MSTPATQHASEPPPPRAAAAPHVMYSTLLGATGANAIPALLATDASVFAMLDGIGVREITEQLATGRLPNEVALYYGLPIMPFRRWLEARIPAEVMDQVRDAAAESLQVKAMLTLTAKLKNPAEASQAKALSERLAKQAEALAPKNWSPSHVSPEKSQPSVTITFQGVGTVDRTMTTVVEHDSSDALGQAGEDDTFLASDAAPAGGSEASAPPADQLPTVDIYFAASPDVARRASEGMDDEG